MVAFEALAIQLIEVIGAQIAVGAVVTQQVVEDDQHAVTDRHHGFLLTQTTSEAVELDGEVVVGGDSNRK